ncbi:MAG TPA: hypothetical protein VD996_05115 [Chitinophagaceae bacterium]|nr:hypothetical protein [Chitinophagaceae bacterium]
MYEFKILADDEQIDVLYRQGVYVGKRLCNSTVMVLYQLDGFYVEISYRKYRHYISSIRCSEGTAILDPYLDQIQAELVVKKDN